MDNRQDHETKRGTLFHRFTIDARRIPRNDTIRCERIYKTSFLRPISSVSTTKIKQELFGLRKDAGVVSSRPRDTSKSSNHHRLDRNSYADFYHCCNNYGCLHILYTVLCRSLQRACSGRIGMETIKRSG